MPCVKSLMFKVPLQFNANCGNLFELIAEIITLVIVYGNSVIPRHG